MIIFSGSDKMLNVVQRLAESQVKPVAAVEEATRLHLLEDSEVYILGSEELNVVKEIQTIFAADKYLSIIVLSSPASFRQVKQSVQLSAYVGKNTLVVAVSEELDLNAICKSAALRTKQKRDFAKLKINTEIKQGGEKIKLAQMGRFLEYAPISALLLTETLHIENHNQQARKLFPSLNLLDVQLSELFANQDAEEIKDFVYQHRNPEDKKEVRIPGKILELTSSEVFVDDGQRHFLLLINDVTYERSEAQRIQSVLEALPQMAWTSSPDGVLNYFTLGWYFYTGQTSEETSKGAWTDVIYPEDKLPMLDRWKESISSVRPFQHACRFRNIKGEYRWHLMRASPIRYNGQEVTMWVGTCTDIHDQILLTEELERKVRERTQSLEVSKNELEQFSHVSSHDLQEPLRKIRTFSDLLRDAYYDCLDDSGKRYLDKISTTAESMSTTLKALLSYTSLQRQEQFSHVDLNEIITQVMEDLEVMITQKEAVVRVDTLPVIKAIPFQMKQLFYNLLNNALKFSKSNIPPEINITCSILNDEQKFKLLKKDWFRKYYQIVVKDNGIGFDQSYADKIFMIFQRLHAKKQFEGTGIGLSLVKRVVINHNGEVHAISQSGEGTAFHIIIPDMP